MQGLSRCGRCKDRAKFIVAVRYAKTVTATVARLCGILQVTAHTHDAIRIIARAIHSVIFFGSIRIIASCATSEDSVRANSEKSKKREPIPFMETIETCQQVTMIADSVEGQGMIKRLEAAE